MMDMKHYVRSWTKHLPKDFTLVVEKHHKRVIFTLVALYLSYRLSCWLFSLIFDSKPSQATMVNVTVRRSSPASRALALLERLIVVAFGLGIGAVAYYAHQQQWDAALAVITDYYRALVGSIVLHATGFDLSRSTLNANETLVVGSVLAGGVIVFLYGVVRFLLHHYIFGSSMALLGAVLAVYRFPISASTAAKYTGSMFLIDRTTLTAALEPTLIPKLLLVLTIFYYLFIVLLKGFTFFLKASFRLLICSLIVSILLNAVVSLVEEAPDNMAEFETSTTFMPKHQY